MNVVTLISSWLGAAVLSGSTLVQEDAVVDESAEAAGAIENAATQVAETGEDLPGQLQEHAQDIGDTLNNSATVQDFSAGILEPIYNLAEFMDFSSFYWCAFALPMAVLTSRLTKVPVRSRYWPNW